MHKRVVVAMSGGVDSSVAAALLLQQGFEVIGMTMCFNLPSAKGKRPSCCGLEGIEDAQRAAHQLGIRHYVVNMQRPLAEYVIKDFCLEYAKGRTPNPCVRCNQFVKFEFLLKKALALGAGFLATGHYARIVKAKSGYQLWQGKDSRKDQSYFLYRTGEVQLHQLLFPVGEYTKEKIRFLAKRFDLGVAQKPDSQEVCFLPDGDYRGFLRDNLPRIKKMLDRDISCGPIVDTNGQVVGIHQGIPFYTIGQRQGLGIARGYPVYVVKIDPKLNTITVGRKQEASASQFIVKDVHFIQGSIKKKIVLGVKIRYNHAKAKAQVQPAQDRMKVVFAEPQFAITPGQSAVFYDGDRVIGGGIIDTVLG